jgi:excisionase family DNA binding protein
MHLLTRNEAAEMLKLAPHTLALWASTGKNLPMVKFGKAVRYRKEDIEKYIEDHLIPSGTSEPTQKKFTRRVN